MADRIQQRRDTKARWEQFNPVLLEGEVGYVLDDVNRYKIGDGIHAWNDLPYRGFDGTIVHDTGDSENAVMSQKAVSEKLTELVSNLANNREQITTFNNRLFQYARLLGDYELYADGFLDVSGKVISSAIYATYKINPIGDFIYFEHIISFGDVLPIIAAYNNNNEFIATLLSSAGISNQNVADYVKIPEGTEYVLVVTYKSNTFSLWNAKLLGIDNVNDIENSVFETLEDEIVHPTIYKENAFLSYGVVVDSASYDIYQLELSNEIYGYEIKEVAARYGAQIYIGALYDNNDSCIKLLRKVEDFELNKTFIGSFSFKTNNASKLLFSVYKANIKPVAYKYKLPTYLPNGIFLMNGYLANRENNYRFVENEDFKCSPFIQIENGVKVKLNTNNRYVTNLVLYDKNFSAIRGEANTGIIDEFITIKDAQYIRVCVANNEIGNVSVIPHFFDSKIKDKNIAFLGDSITAQGYVTNALKTNKRCNILNYGVGGSTLSSQGNRNEPYLDNFVTRFDNVITDDVNSGTVIDCLVMWGGINDFAVMNNLGEIGQANDEQTFYASLHHLAQKQRELLKNKPILWITPMHDSYSQNSTHYDWKIVDGVFSYNNNNNAFLYEYVNAIKEVASIYGIRVLDLYSLFPAPQIKSDLYLDNLHPNEKGGILISELIYNELKNIVV